MIRIVALDTAVMTYDGVTFDAFRTVGALECFDRSAPLEILARSQNADALLVNKVVLTREILASLPRLRYVGVTATGTNNVDIEACRQLGIAVTNVVGYSSDSVAQYVFAYILHHFVKVDEVAKSVRSGAWESSKDFCYYSVPQREVSSLTLGIVGVGAIGGRVAELGAAFGMKVLLGATPGRGYSEPRIDLNQLARSADVISLHCALSPATAEMINCSFLAQCKPSTVLINASRGGLVNEAELAFALQEGKIAAYYADVLSTEPPKADNPLLSAPRVILTPHIAWATPEARKRLVHESYLNLIAFQSQERRNRVD